MMTRKCLVLLCSLSFLVAVNAVGQYSHIKNIVGSDHDLSSTHTAGSIYAVSETEICYFCHAPHQSLNTSDKTVTTGPTPKRPCGTTIFLPRQAMGFTAAPVSMLWARTSLTWAEPQPGRLPSPTSASVATTELWASTSFITDNMAQAARP